jgi:hypothetical protein
VDTNGDSFLTNSVKEEKCYMSNLDVTSGMVTRLPGPSNVATVPVAIDGNLGVTTGAKRSGARLDGDVFIRVGGRTPDGVSQGVGLQAKVAELRNTRDMTRKNVRVHGVTEMIERDLLSKWQVIVPSMSKD